LGDPSRRKRGRKRKAVDKVEALLDRVKGKTDNRPDRSSASRFLGFRTLDLIRHRETFERLVSLDFDFLLSQKFAATPGVLADLLPQSVLGRAQNGHGWFTDEFGTSLRFPDATFDRVLSVLESADGNLKGHFVRERRGRMLARFREWIFANIGKPELDLVIDGSPLFGVDFLAEKKVETRAFLTGLVLAGFMDDWSSRETTMLEHRRTFSGMPFHIGGGEILIVDREKFEMCGLGDTGSVLFDNEQLRTLRDIGVVCLDRDAAYSHPEYDQAYFRRRMGDGICDDLAMIYIGAQHGYDAMLGAFVMDAIDTYDKFLLDLTWGGFDTHLAGRLQRHFRDLEDQPLVDDREIFHLIHFAAKRNEPTINLSSSHRRLIQYEKNSKVPTLLNHWRFLQGELIHDIKLGFSRVPARQFYDVAKHRLAAVALPVLEPRYFKDRKSERT
jgi:hypothetical protein